MSETRLWLVGWKQALLLALALSLPGPSAGAASFQSAGGVIQVDAYFPPEGATNYGSRVASGGDVDGDGFADCLVGVSLYGPGALGAVFVYSGPTGDLIRRIDGTHLGVDSSFGLAVAGAGDVDGDGFDDVIVGAPRKSTLPGPGDHGAVSVFSGATGQELWTAFGSSSLDFLGASVTGMGDVDGDGLPDVAAGAPSTYSPPNGGPGYVAIYRGYDGQFIRSVSGNSVPGAFGSSISGVGDIDGDGRGDVLVGAPATIVPNVGAAFVISGATGGVLWEWYGTHDGERFGLAVAALGDVDHGGTPDFMVGGHGLQTGHGGNTVQVFQGESGQRLWEVQTNDVDEMFGLHIAGADDFNADGFLDFAVSAPRAAVAGNGRPGAVYLYSGHDGSLFRRIEGRVDGSRFGGGLSGAGDTDGDGRAELLVGILDLRLGYSGVRVLGFNPILSGDATSLSALSGGTVNFGMAFPESEAGLPYAVLASLSGTGPTRVTGVDVPLTVDALTKRTALKNPPQISSGAIGTIPPDGLATAVLDAPPGALVGKIGSTVYVAAVSLEPDSRVLRTSSVAVPLEIVP